MIISGGAEARARSPEGGEESSSQARFAGRSTSGRGAAGLDSAELASSRLALGSSLSVYPSARTPRWASHSPGLPPGRVERRDHRGVLVLDPRPIEEEHGDRFGEFEAADDRAGSEPDLKVIEQLLGERAGIELADELNRAVPAGDVAPAERTSVAYVLAVMSLGPLGPECLVAGALRIRTCIRFRPMVWGSRARCATPVRRSRGMPPGDMHGESWSRTQPAQGRIHGAGPTGPASSLEAPGRILICHPGHRATALRALDRHIYQWPHQSARGFFLIAEQPPRPALASST
jgi:hypothetical protein